MFVVEKVGLNARFQGATWVEWVCVLLFLFFLFFSEAFSGLKEEFEVGGWEWRVRYVGWVDGLFDFRDEVHGFFGGVHGFYAVSIAFLERCFDQFFSAIKA